MTRPGDGGWPQQDDPFVRAFRSALASQSYMLNSPWRVPSSCEACRVPLQLSDEPWFLAPPAGEAQWELCGRCRWTSRELGGQVCDRTVFLTSTWDVAGSQSAATMYGYKRLVGASAKSREDLAKIVRYSTHIHDGCLQEFVQGRRWDFVSYVPSTSRERPGDHPLAELSRKVVQVTREPVINSIALSAGPVRAGRKAARARFAVNPDSAHLLDGAHVLLVDDTWVSGTSIQSAAAALKGAGAASVTGLLVSRLLKPDYDQLHVQLVRQQQLDAPYDPFRCITHPRNCIETAPAGWM